VRVFICLLVALSVVSAGIAFAMEMEDSTSFNYDVLRQALASPHDSTALDEQLASLAFFDYFDMWSQGDKVRFPLDIVHWHPAADVEEAEVTGMLYDDCLAAESSVKWPVTFQPGWSNPFIDFSMNDARWMQIIFVLQPKNVDEESEYYSAGTPQHIYGPSRVDSAGILAVRWKDRIIIQPPVTVSGWEKEVVGKLGYDRAAGRVFYILKDDGTLTVVSFLPGDRCSKARVNVPESVYEGFKVDDDYPLLIEGSRVFVRLEKAGQWNEEPLRDNDSFLITEFATGGASRATAKEVCRHSGLVKDILSFGAFGWGYMDHWGKWFLVRAPYVGKLGGGIKYGNNPHHDILYLVRQPFPVERYAITDRAYMIRSARFAPNPRYVILTYSYVWQGTTGSWVILYDLLAGGAEKEPGA
jgi:hypothetical protein